MEDQTFNGKPSIVLNHRPFFSIIVACYNSAPYLGELLQSIVEQHMQDDLEVILSDDCSTESYDEIVNHYNKILSIKRVQTDYNFAPGNTRQKGISVASGKWLVFADHDDKFIPDTLKVVKENILQFQEPYYIICDFEEQNPDTGEQILYFSRPNGWCHGKFFNVDNLWNKFNVRFEKDLRSHEDIYICSIMNCIMNYLGRQPLYLDFPCYIWNKRNNSLSKSMYENVKGNQKVTFFEHFFDDYLHSTADVYINGYQHNMITYNFALENVIEVIAYSYFYLMGFMFHNPSYLKRNETLCRKLLLNAKEVFGISNEDIYNILSANDAEIFTQIQKTAEIGAGPYIPCMTLKEYLITYGRGSNKT